MSDAPSGAASGSWTRVERDGNDVEEYVELIAVGSDLHRRRGVSSSLDPLPRRTTRRYASPASATKALRSAVATLVREGFAEVGAVLRPIEDPKVAVVPSRRPIDESDPRWVAFAASLREAGIDPTRTFWEQATPEKSAGGDWERKCSDADARAIVCLRIARELFGARLPEGGPPRYHTDAGAAPAEHWPSAKLVFAVACTDKLA